MRARSIILFLLAISLFSTYTAAQEKLDLPAAPSASKRDSKAAPPAAKPKVSKDSQSAAPHDATEKPPSDNASQPAQAAQSASSSSSAADDTAETIRRTVNEVNVVFTVTDKHGRYVKDLKKNDFTVVDDNRPAQEIRSFHTETD